MTDLLYTLGLDITEFKTSARAANEQADDIKRSLRNFKDVIGVGGVGVAVLGFFRSVVQHAMEAKGAVDENTAAVQRFGAAIEQNKGTLMNWGAQALGTLNRVGEVIGLGLRVQIEAVTNAWDRLKSGDFKGAMGMDPIRKAYQDVVREHQRDVELSKEEARLNAEKVQAATRDKQLREEANRLTQQEHDLRLKSLTAQERVNQLGNEYWAKVRELATFEGNALDRREKENAVRKAGIVLLQAQQDLVKDTAETEKDAAQAAKQAAAEKKRAQEDELQRVEEATRLRLKGVENLTAAEKVQLEILEGRLTKESRLAEIKLLSAKLTDGTITPAEKERLAALVGQTVEMEKQVSLLEAQVKITKALNVRGFDQFEDASDEALQALIRKNQSAISRNNALMFSQGNMGNLTTNWDNARLQQEAANAKQELQFRQQLRRNINIGGEDFARSQFSGDPLLFDEVLQRVTGTWDRQDKTNDLLEKTNRKLDQLTGATTTGLRDVRLSSRDT